MFWSIPPRNDEDDLVHILGVLLAIQRKSALTTKVRPDHLGGLADELDIRQHILGRPIEARIRPSGRSSDSGGP